MWLLSEERSKRRKEKRKVRVRGHTPVDQGGRGVREVNRRLRRNTRRKTGGEGLKERLEGKEKDDVREETRNGKRRSDETGSKGLKPKGRGGTGKRVRGQQRVVGAKVKRFKT